MRGPEVSSRATRASVLPPGTTPLGLSREQAATYIGVSTSTFDRMIKDGMMPKPRPHLRTDSVEPEKAGARVCCAGDMAV